MSLLCQVYGVVLLHSPWLYQLPDITTRAALILLAKFLEAKNKEQNSRGKSEILEYMPILIVIHHTK